MTSGSWTTGDSSPAGFPVYRFHSGKSWNGVDGRTIPGRVSRKVNWNPYSMDHRVFRSVGNPSHGVVVGISGPVDVTNISWSEAVTWNTVPTDGDSAGAARFAELFTQKDEYALLAKLLQKVKGSSFNVGVSLAEVDKLSSGVVSTIKQLCFGVEDLYHGRFEKFARRFGASPPRRSDVSRLRLRDVSGRFLEMRYAWTPAIQDVFAASEAFESLSNGPRQQTFKVGRSRRVNGKMEGNWYFHRNFTRVARRTYTYEAYEELGAFRQMGLANPASIIWERLPWSFVIDWFIPVGSYLELVGQIPALKGRFMRTDSFTENYDGSYGLSPNSVGVTSVTLAGIITGHHYWTNRTIPSSLSVPFPTVKVAGAVQGKRVQNAVALAHQLFISAVQFGFGKPSLRKGRVVYRDFGVSDSLLEKIARF